MLAYVGVSSSNQDPPKKSFRVRKLVSRFPPNRAPTWPPFLQWPPCWHTQRANDHADHARSDEGQHTLVELAWQAKRRRTGVVRARNAKNVLLVLRVRILRRCGLPPLGMHVWSMIRQRNDHEMCSWTQWTPNQCVHGHHVVSEVERCGFRASWNACLGSSGRKRTAFLGSPEPSRFLKVYYTLPGSFGLELEVRSFGMRSGALETSPRFSHSHQRADGTKKKAGRRRCDILSEVVHFGPWTSKTSVNT